MPISPRVIRARRDGRPPDPLAGHYPTASDGLRSIAAIRAAVDSSSRGGEWTEAHPASMLHAGPAWRRVHTASCSARLRGDTFGSAVQTQPRRDVRPPSWLRLRRMFEREGLRGHMAVVKRWFCGRHPGQGSFRQVRETVGSQIKAMRALGPRSSHRSPRSV